MGKNPIRGQKPSPKPHVPVTNSRPSPLRVHKRGRPKTSVVGQWATLSFHFPFISCLWVPSEPRYGEAKPRNPRGTRRRKDIITRSMPVGPRVFRIWSSEEEGLQVGGGYKSRKSDCSKGPPKPQKTPKTKKKDLSKMAF